MLSLLLLVVAASDPVLALRGLDPVALVKGAERAGDPAHAVTRGEYTYRFADARSLAEFQARPERYEIQLGGCCGRMGPLSGKGSPERWLVHEGSLFIFASEQCRDSFNKQPQAFLDPDEPAPAADEAARKRGAALLERALAAHGGAARIDVLSSLEYFQSVEVEDKNGKHAETLSRAIVFPGRYRQHQTWGPDWAVTHVSAPGAAFTELKSGSEELHASGARELARTLRRIPLVILRSRGEPGFSCSYAGSAEHGGTKVEEIACSFAGTTTYLGIEEASGRVLSARYRGRGPRLAFGSVIKLFSGFHDAGGVLVPGHAKGFFDGADAGERDFELRVDPNLEPELFRRPG